MMDRSLSKFEDIAEIAKALKGLAFEESTKSAILCDKAGHKRLVELVYKLDSSKYQNFIISDSLSKCALFLGIDESVLKEF